MDATINPQQRKKMKLELGTAFISCINETIQSVASGSLDARQASLNKEVTVQTRGCQLQTRDLDVMKEAVKIAIAAAAVTVANSHAMPKNQLIETLWPGSNTIVATLSLSPQSKFVWDLNLDE